MSSIASGAPAPLSASTLADAAARDRERENGVHSKRPREWDSREDLYGSNHKKNASEENRSRLEDPYSRRFQSPPTVMQPERERREYERPPYGENSAPTNSYASPRPPNEGDLRRANEDYKPSAVAHQPAPLSTVLHQEQPQPPREPARPTLPPMNAQQPNGIESNAAKTEQPEPERMEVEEETKPSTEAPRQPEEPAARNMEVDENYDDDSTEESKPLAGGSGRESRASQRSAKEPVSASSNPQPEPTSATAGA